ncbi:MAG TPA: DUF3856 domain-containing protein [Caulobacteraceae bacterium]|jgi:tetratricopeptide (TPR) repeat protein
MPDAGHRYWAFLSYSHDDRRWAAWLHRALEGLKTPPSLVGQPTPAGPAPKRMRPIFRDRDELGAATDLGERLHAALQGSAYQIVICSPAAARSRWVGEEVRQFKALHGEDRVLAVIVAGEPFAGDAPGPGPAECFPTALRFHVEADGTVGERPAEPVAADLRPGKDGRRLALLKLQAGMLQADLDLLVHRDARRRNRQMLAVTSASLAGSAVLAGLTVMALKERNEAIAERTQAEGLIEFMVGDLRKRLEPAGHLDALDAVGARAMTYYAAQTGHGQDADSLGRRARVLQLLGDIRDRRGDLGAALKLFQESANSTGELLARNPRDPQRIFDHAQSVYWVGYIAWRRGQDEIAKNAFLDYRRLADQLVAIDAKNQDWQAEVGMANSNLGTVLLDDGRADEAAAAFSRALDISQTLARDAPANRERQWFLGQCYAWLADAQALRGRFDEAAASRLAERAIYQRRLAQSADDNAITLALAVNATAMARILLATGHRSQALEDLRAATADFERLIVAVPDNSSYKSKATPAFVLLGQSLLQDGDVDAAEPAARRALDLAEALQRKDSTVVEWRGPRLGAARLLKIRIDAMRAGSAPALKAVLEPSVAEAAQMAVLSDARPRHIELARTAAEASLLAGDYASLNAADAEARAHWTRAAAMLDRAGAVALPASDRSHALLRQLGFRLDFAHPPIGRLPGTTARFKVDFRTGAQSHIDYAW